MVGHMCDLEGDIRMPSCLDPDACSYDGQSAVTRKMTSFLRQNMGRIGLYFCELSDLGLLDAETETCESDAVSCKSSASTDYPVNTNLQTGSLTEP